MIVFWNMSQSDAFLTALSGGLGGLGSIVQSWSTDAVNSVARHLWPSAAAGDGSSTPSAGAGATSPLTAALPVDNTTPSNLIHGGVPLVASAVTTGTAAVRGAVQDSASLVNIKRAAIASRLHRSSPTSPVFMLGLRPLFATAVADSNALRPRGGLLAFRWPSVPAVAFLRVAGVALGVITVGAVLRVFLWPSPQRSMFGLTHWIIARAYDTVAPLVRWLVLHSTVSAGSESSFGLLMGSTREVSPDRSTTRQGGLGLATGAGDGNDETAEALFGSSEEDTTARSFVVVDTPAEASAPLRSRTIRATRESLRHAVLGVTYACRVASRIVRPLTSWLSSRTVSFFLIATRETSTTCDFDEDAAGGTSRGSHRSMFAFLAVNTAYRRAYWIQYHLYMIAFWTACVAGGLFWSRQSRLEMDAIVEAIVADTAAGGIAGASTTAKNQVGDMTVASFLVHAGNIVTSLPGIIDNAAAALFNSSPARAAVSLNLYRYFRPLIVVLQESRHSIRWLAVTAVVAQCGHVACLWTFVRRHQQLKRQQPSGSAPGVADSSAVRLVADNLLNATVVISNSAILPTLWACGPSGLPPTFRVGLLLAGPARLLVALAARQPAPSIPTDTTAAASTSANQRRASMDQRIRGFFIRHGPSLLLSVSFVKGALIVATVPYFVGSATLSSDVLQSARRSRTGGPAAVLAALDRTFQETIAAVSRLALVAHGPVQLGLSLMKVWGASVMLQTVACATAQANSGSTGNDHDDNEAAARRTGPVLFSSLLLSLSWSTLWVSTVAQLGRWTAIDCRPTVTSTLGVSDGIVRITNTIAFHAVLCEAAVAFGWWWCILRRSSRRKPTLTTEPRRSAAQQPSLPTEATSDSGWTVV